MNPILIQVLPENVIDQIAAGEVIERPAQLVKELAENSLDAGSTAITINVSNGGCDVKISDNGHGIHKDQLSKALERFATSKIKVTDDLWSLNSFGFRGEALASISAVSELTLTSKTKSQSQAARVISRYGDRSKPDEIGGEIGTEIEVKGLFQNIPARLKFLKSAGAEVLQIKQTLKALALSNPQVTWKLLIENELIFFWPAVDSRLERVKQVLEIDKMYEGTAERDGVKAYSVFADPNQVNKTSKNIWLFAQSRWIQDRGLQAAVMEAYRNLLMHGEYPVCVTWVETDPKNIDVNVHPSKSQVKFHNSSLAFRAVQASVRSVLETAPWIQRMQNEESLLSKAAPIKYEMPEPQNLSFESTALTQTQYPQKSFELKDSATAMPMHIQFEGKTEKTAGFWSQLQVLGQAHLTYIITQSQDGVYFIDQHAAHERVMFERLMNGFKSNNFEIQSFLFPLTIDLQSEKIQVLKSSFEDFKKFGIALEEMGPQTLAVTSAPTFLKDKALCQVLEKAAEDMIDIGESYSFENKLSDLCSTMACHSAIRAGQSLSTHEMKALLEEMDEYPMSSFCPHGRPVFVSYPIKEIEKDFGRTL